MFFIKKKNSIRAINSNITSVQRTVNNPLTQIEVDFSFRVKALTSWESDLSLPSGYTTSNYIFITAYLWTINDERGTLNRISFNTSNNKLHVAFLTVGDCTDNNQYDFYGKIAAMFYKKSFPNA